MKGRVGMVLKDWQRIE